MHASLADVLADLVQNGIEAGADRIDVSFYEGHDEIRFVVKDSGKGMDQATLRRAEDPFWTDGVKHPGRRIGLGIPFLRQTAQQCAGHVDIDSTPGFGTRVEAVFPAEHLDLPPIGDLALLWVQCLSFDGGYGMAIRRERRGPDGRLASYGIERAEVADALGGLEDAGALGLLREYVVSLEASLDNEIDE